MSIKMNPFDRASALLGAPVDRWKPHEVQQMRKIHACFQNAYNPKQAKAKVYENHGHDETNQFAEFAAKNEFGQDLSQVPDFDDIGAMQLDPANKNGPGLFNPAPKPVDADGEANVAEDVEAKDEEWYLPKDSPLRSKNGEKKMPMLATFKDYENFEFTLNFDKYWRDGLSDDTSGVDPVLRDVATDLVQSLCVWQSRGELRLNNATKMVPLRKKREQISPLALVLHELKLWAANRLSKADVLAQSTHTDIWYRMRYIERLSEKEVWGNPVGFFSVGIRPESQDNLFRLLSHINVSLKAAYEHAFRMYNSRSSREKLRQLDGSLRRQVMDEMTTLSALMTLHESLSDGKHQDLNVSSLLKPLKEQGNVDYSNFVNVLMYRLCKEPLVRAVLISDKKAYEDKEANLSDDLSAWAVANLFVKQDGTFAGKPEAKFKNSTGVPEAYYQAEKEVFAGIKAYRKGTGLPLNGKHHINSINKAFAFGVNGKKNTKEVMELVLQVAGAIQNIFPAIHAVQELYNLAGDGGNMAVYDKLRDECVRLMLYVKTKSNELRTARDRLVYFLMNLRDEKLKIRKEEHLKGKRKTMNPDWVNNLHYLTTDKHRLPKLQENFNSLVYIVKEIAQDAYNYNLKQADLDDKVENYRSIVNKITGDVFVPPVPEAAIPDSSESIGMPAKTRSNAKQDDGEFGSNGLFESRTQFSHSDAGEFNSQFGVADAAKELDIQEKWADDGAVDSKSSYNPFGAL